MTEPPGQPPPPPTPPPYPYSQPYPPPPQPYAGYSAPPPQPYAGYSAPPPQPYAGYSAPPVGPRNGLGIASLIIAIIALVTCASVVLGVILGIVAIVIGFAARGRVKRGEANNGGVAIAGIVLGFIAIIASLAFIAIWVAVFREVGGQDYIDCLNRAGNDSKQIQKCADQFRHHIEERYSVTLTP
jgi:hypothetical protein